MANCDARDQKQADDLRLLRKYAETRDADAFRLVARRYLDFVYTVCLRELRDAQAAEDATQETFIALAKNARRLRSDTVLPSWLFAVASTQCRESRRRDARRRRLETPPAKPSRGQDQGLELHLALASLAPRDREAVILRVMMDYTHQEVAQALGVSEDAARMRTDRALKRLRETAGAAALAGWKLERAPFDFDHRRLPATPLHRLKPSWVLLAGAFLAGGSFWAANSVLGGTQAVGGTTPDSVASFAPVLARWEADGLLPMHAKVSIYEGGRFSYAGETWRTAEVTRWRQPWKPGTIEAEIKGGTLKSMRTGVETTPNTGTIMIGSPESRVVDTDAFESALLELPVYLYSRPPLKALPLPSQNEFQSSDGRSYRITRDPKHDNRVSKVDYRYKEHHFVTTVDSWQTVSGITIPASLTMEGWFKDTKSPTRILKITDVQFGSDAPKPPALPKPDHGSLVMDERRSVIYRVDENWKRISEEQKVANGDVGGG